MTVLRKIYLGLLPLIGVCVFVSCTSKSIKLPDSLTTRLKNRGPVALSTDNPFLAANLLLTREMERSPEIQGFIRHRGAPAALEIEHGWLSPLTYHFYYPENREQFTLEELEGTWAIRGPFFIPDESFAVVSEITSRSSGKPVVNFPDNTDIASFDPQQERAQKQLAESGRELSLRDDPVMAPKMRSANHVPMEKKKDQMAGLGSPSRVVVPHVPGPSDSQPKSNERQEIERIVRYAETYPAELTPKGDLVHYVTYKGETLSMIARWYTFDRGNAPRLARINRLQNPNALNIGDTIIVPRYLLRNRNRLTQRSVADLTALAERTRR